MLPQYADGYEISEDATLREIGVFHSYYPNTMVGVNSAGMYPIRPIVAGHTYYTYQPLYPHEYLYEHLVGLLQRLRRSRHVLQDPGRRGGACAGPGYGLNKTTVVWQAGPLAINPNPIRILPLEGVRNAVGRFGALGGCQGCR
ncbi:MAG: hypothetical protein R3B96_06230 [Pirellulaceae bacterium]